MFSSIADAPSDTFEAEALGWKATGAGRGRRLCLVGDCAAGAADVKDIVANLRQDEWQVTVLDLSPPASPDHKCDGAGYQRLAGLYRQTNWYIQMQSLAAYHWLRAQELHVILFQRGFAAGFYSCMARHRSLAFAQTPIAILAEAPHAMTLEQSRRFPSGRHDFEIDFMERRAVELADGVLWPAQDVGQWAHAAGWKTSAPAAYLDMDAKTQGCGAWLNKRIESAAKEKAKKEKPVFISVCIATYNRAAWLRGALESLRRQTHASFEVVVVDDGSTDPDVEKLKDELKPLFAEKKWCWVRQDNAGPAAARNRAAKVARSDHLLFMDDDNVAYADELERFARAAQKDYDIITCILGLHPESELVFPPTAQLPERQSAATRPVGWTPIGGDLALAALINVLGDTNSLFRREVFEKLGGFPIHSAAVLEDFELLTQALAAGYRIDVIPEVLLLYRRTRQSRSMGRAIFEGHVNSLKPIAELMPPALRALLPAVREEWYQRHCRRRDDEL